MMRHLYSLLSCLMFFKMLQADPLLFHALKGRETGVSLSVSDTVSNDLADSLQLHEVLIKGNSIVRDATGYLVNIQNNKFFKPLDLQQTLELLPGFTIMENRITVNGMEVGKIYINKREVRMSGDALIDYLKSQSACNIKNIRVVNRGGAEQSAEKAGMAILYVTTASNLQGGNATITLDSDINEHAQGVSILRLNMNLRYGKWSSYMMSSYRRRWMETPGTNKKLFEQSDKEVVTVAHPYRRWQSPKLTIGAGYDFSPHDVFTVEGNVDCFFAHDIYRSDVTVTQDAVLADSYQMAGRGASRRRDGYVAADYVHDWNKGELQVAATWAQENHAEHNQMSRCDNPSQWSSNYQIHHHYRLWQGQVDLTEKVNRASVVKAGVAFNQWRNCLENDNQLISMGHENPWSAAAHEFRYKETTSAAYTSYDFKRKEFSASLGIRFEWKTVHSQLFSFDDNGNLRQTYKECFPNVRLGYVLNAAKGHQLSLAYVRQWKMPSMYMLAPVKTWNDEFSYTVGNPYLQPVCVDKVSAGMTVFNYFTLTAGWAKSPLFTSLYIKENDADRAYSTYEQGGSSQSLSLSLSAMKTVGGSFILNMNAMYDHSTNELGGLRVLSDTFVGSASMSGMLQHGWSLRGNVLYVSASRGLTTKGTSLFSGSLHLDKSWFAHNVKVSLGYQFYPHQTQHLMAPGVSGKMISNKSAHTLELSVVCRLDWGGKSLRVRKNKRLGDSEIRRMGGE